MLLDEVATYLAAQSTAFTVGASGNLMKSIMLDDDTADTVTVLYEQAGVFSQQTFSTGNIADIVYERPNLQILCRSTSYQTARNNAETAYNLLDGLSETTMTSVRYLSVDAVSPPFSIGRDANQRHLVSCNYNIRKEVS